VLKKKIAILLSAAMAAVMLLGACAGAPAASASPSPSASATDDSVAVAQMDGQSVYMTEFKAWLDQNIQGGASVLENEAYASEMPDLLDSFISFKIIHAELEKRGYINNLTSEQLEQAQQNAQDEIDYALNTYKMTEDEYLKKSGVTKDQLLDQYKFYTAANIAYTDTALTGDTTPKEEDIKAEYDKNVASDQQTMDADPTQYVSSVSDGAKVYYVPAGVRLVRAVLIGFDEDTSGAISTLRDAGYNDQADLIKNEGIKAIQEKADETSKNISSGKLSFTDAVAQSDDKDMPADGYPVVTGTKQYGDLFTQTALALESVGKVSELIATDKGYQILEYTSDLPQGPVAYESVKDKISADLQTSLQSDAWNALVEQWKKDHSVECNYDAL
jgi:hypothetical protein